MGDRINKKRLFDNITLLIKNQGIKVGEFEKSVGVSTGYISRTSKEDGPSPGMEFIVGAAEALKVSIDSLLRVDYSDLSPTEEFLLPFFEKLIQDTLEYRLEWVRRSYDSLDEIEHDDSETGQTHPLFAVRSFFEDLGDEYPEYVTRNVFASHTFGVHTAVVGDEYSLALNSESTLYLEKIARSVHSARDNTCVVEMWIKTAKEPPQFLCSDFMTEQLSWLIAYLYISVEEYCKHPRVTRGTRKAIESFMNVSDTGD